MVFHPKAAFAAPIFASHLQSNGRSVMKTEKRKKWSTCRVPRMMTSDSPPDHLKPKPHRYEWITWDKVEHMSKELALLAKPYNIDLVLSITRGGMVPATLICERLELRNILSATLMFYTDDGEQFFGMTEPRFLSFPSMQALEGRNVLIVDDVWDTGRTAHAVRNRVARANPNLVKVGVLHFKPEMNEYPGEEPDFYAAITQKWVVYPWEKLSPQAPVMDASSNAVSQSSVASDSEAQISGTSLG